MRFRRFGMVAACCSVLALPLHAQTVSAVADSGTADAGIASRPIANVAANDLVNGAPAVLGTSGNATVAKVGTWSSGIALTPTTGAISTTTAVPAGTYSVQYQLCDLNTPKDCATTTDMVTVITSSIVPGADSGTAVAGIASKPVSNVAANDTVNGAAATLGAPGNSTVAQKGTWPTGITLAGGTGAVTTTTATPPGSFPLSYTLCDRNSPANCATGSVSISVSASIVALPISGTALVNTAATAIPNVVVNDTVNGSAATLGSSGNATVSQVGTWQSGIVLNTTTGAVTTSTGVAPAQYNLQYQLCDLNSTPDCATAYATVTVTPQYSEVQATSQQMGDVELDFGRDGVSCTSCNFGDGNNRANWTDRLGNLWIAHLDPLSGLFVSANAEDELADTTAYFWNTWGNGPEWTFSTQNGQVVSQLVYSRWQPGQAAQPQPAAGYSGAAYVTQTGYNDYNNGVGTNWSAKWLPGAIGKGNGNKGTANSNLPEGSQCNTDSVAEVMYKNFASPLQSFTEQVNTTSNPLLVTLPSDVVSNGIGERFVPCTHQLLLQATVPYSNGSLIQQVFWYNIDTGVVEQLTSDPTTKYAGFMFKAPDFGDNYIFFTVANHTTVQVYEQTGTNSDGSPIFALVNSITSPDPNEIYINSPEPFINCTPTCTTYIFATLSKTSDSQNGLSVPNGLVVIPLAPPIPPAIQAFNILVTANSLPAFQRLDPEYFITPQGPYLYYNRITPQTGSSTYKNNGEYFIDMKLGAPSGPCVGSSAQDGLMPGC